MTEDTFVLFNPLPDISERELFKRAGLENVDINEHGVPFRFRTVLDGEFVGIDPGGKIVIRESEVALIKGRATEVGLGIVPSDASDDVVNTETKRALRTAFLFYSSRGKRRLQQLRKTHGLTAEEMDERRDEYWAYHVNGAKADFISEALAAHDNA